MQYTIPLLLGVEFSLPFSELLNTQGQIQEGVDWVASHLFGGAKKKSENSCEYYGGNKSKESGQVPYCNFYFVTACYYFWCNSF